MLEALILWSFYVIHSMIDSTGDAFGYKAERPGKFKWKYHRVMEHFFQFLLIVMSMFLLVFAAKNFHLYSFNIVTITFWKAVFFICLTWGLVRQAVFDPSYNLQIGEKWGYVGKSGIYDIFRRFIVALALKTKFSRFLVQAWNVISGGNVLSKVIYLLTSFLILDYIIN